MLKRINWPKKNQQGKNIAYNVLLNNKWLSNSFSLFGVTGMEAELLIYPWPIHVSWPLWGRQIWQLQEGRSWSGKEGPDPPDEPWWMRVELRLQPEALTSHSHATCCVWRVWRKRKIRKGKLKIWKDKCKLSMKCKSNNKLRIPS